MIYKFVDNKGTFRVDNPERYNLYFPLVNQSGSLLSSISPNLAGDIKKDNEHFLTPPASVEDLRSNLLCRRDFFLKLDKQVLRLSNPYKDTLEAGLLYHKVIKEIGSLYIEILNFIPFDLPVEVMWIKIKNRGKHKVDFTPTSFIPLYARSEKNLRDHRHVSSLLNRLDLDRRGIYLKPTMVFDEKGHKVNREIYFVLGYEANAGAFIGQFPTLDYFYGRGDILNPSAVMKEGIMPVNKAMPEFQGKEACAAFRFRKRQLSQAQEADYALIMGIEEDRQKIKNIFLKLNSPAKIKRSLEATKTYWQNCVSRLDFDFKDVTYNNWLSWVKMQPMLRKLFGCSFLPHFDYGKGGRGWRDLWQDILALLLTEPDKARALIMHNFKGVRIDGSNATIVTREGEFIADRNRISRVWMDHGIWPYLSLRLYINKTADLDILFKEVTYFRDHQLKRSKEVDPGFCQRDYLLRTRFKKVYKGSILEHILAQNLVQFFNVGRHNAVCLENADWNDGLDMAFEKGESVTFSFMYAHNLMDLCGILKEIKKKQEYVALFEEINLLLDRLNSPINYSDYKKKQKRLADYFKKTKSISGEKIKIKIGDLILDLDYKSRHLFNWLRKKEWLKEPGFFNGYYDNNACRAEGRIKGRVRMMLASQVFPIMSEGATGGQIKKIWGSVTRYLKDNKLGGFRLNTDFGSLYLSLGRAFGFVYGDKENGAFFNHMSVMLANALYRRGFVREGNEAFNSIYRMAANESAKIYPMVPEYFNRQGEGKYFYLTGSASWYIYTLFEEVLGIKFSFGDLILEPRLTSDNFFNDFIKVKFCRENKILEVIYERKKAGNKVYRIKELFFEEKKILPRNKVYIIKKEMLKQAKKEKVSVRIILG